MTNLDQESQNREYNQSTKEGYWQNYDCQITWQGEHGLKVNKYVINTQSGASKVQTQQAQ
jgi:hypothetical protein